MATLSPVNCCGRVCSRVASLIRILLVGTAVVLLAACGGGSSSTPVNSNTGTTGNGPPNTIQGYVYDNQTIPSPIQSALVTVNAGLGPTQIPSDTSGRFVLSGLAAGTYTVTISKTNYETATYNGVVVTDAVGADMGTVTLLAPLTTGQMRVVLTWGFTPSDLDLHACTPNNVQIWYSNQTDNLAPELSLDVDDTSSYGPETMTFTSFQTGTYAFWVEDFTNSLASTSQLSISGAQIKVSDSTGQLATYSVPAGAAADAWWWLVLRVDGSTQNVTTVNSLTAVDPSNACPTTSPPFSYGPRVKTKPVKAH